MCDVNTACQATGDVCCCHQVQGICGPVQANIPKSWNSTRNCGNGCCGDYCCGEEPTANCYSNKQCYMTKGPCQACQKAGQDCVYETNQCSVDSDCVKYASNWICNPSFKCCVPPQVTTTTTTTTLAGCWSDRECVFENGHAIYARHLGRPVRCRATSAQSAETVRSVLEKPETLPVILILGAVILRLSVRLTATVRLYMVRIGRVITVSIVPIMVQTLTVWMAPESGSVTARSRDALMGRM